MRVTWGTGPALFPSWSFPASRHSVARADFAPCAVRLHRVHCSWGARREQRGRSRLQRGQPNHRRSRARPDLQHGRGHHGPWQRDRWCRPDMRERFAGREFPMRYAATLSLVAASLVGSVALPDCVNAQNSSTNPLDRLFLEESDDTPLYKILSFNSVTAVQNYYGVVSQQASLAQEFFNGCNDCGANMLFTRFPDLPARAHLYGANISGMTIPELQTISGSLKIMSQGYQLSGTVNLSNVAGFGGAGVRITNALNKRSAG